MPPYSPADATCHVYMCPVYKTEFRGPTFVFVATLKTDGDRRRWISAGVAISFQTAD